MSDRQVWAVICVVTLLEIANFISGMAGLRTSSAIDVAFGSIMSIALTDKFLFRPRNGKSTKEESA